MYGKRVKNIHVHLLLLKWEPLRPVFDLIHEFIISVLGFPGSWVIPGDLYPRLMSLQLCDFHIWWRVRLHCGGRKDSRERQMREGLTSDQTHMLTGTHPLTYGQRCEVLKVAGGIARDGCNTKEGCMSCSQVILIVVQSAPVARESRWVGALQITERLRWAVRGWKERHKKEGSYSLRNETYSFWVTTTVSLSISCLVFHVFIQLWPYMVGFRQSLVSCQTAWPSSIQRNHLIWSLLHGDVQFSGPIAYHQHHCLSSRGELPHRMTLAQWIVSIVIYFLPGFMWYTPSVHNKFHFHVSPDWNT